MPTILPSPAARSFAAEWNALQHMLPRFALEEGLGVNHHKTRIMRPSTRQQLAGIVVNQTVSLRRHELDLLEAILTNCVRRGAASQNRDGVLDFRAYLQGKVSYVEMVDRGKGQRLRTIFEAIDWER
jgi:RNA-directed DNA polymerase